MLGFPTPTPATGAASIRSSWDRVTTTPPDGGIRRNRARPHGPARRLWPDDPADPHLGTDGQPAARDPETE